MAHSVPPEHSARTPVPAHAAFPLGLGFVAGFVDVFGFMAWYGLLTAHATGNLIFLALDLVRGQYELVMKLLALPIFAVSIALSAWLIGSLIARGKAPFAPSIIVQSALLAVSLLAGMLLPSPTGPDDVAVIVSGSFAVAAMGLQNTNMRLVLNNLPPTTVMTGNITNAVCEVVLWSAGYHQIVLRHPTLVVARQARQIGITLSAFTVGAIAGGLSEIHVGYPSLLLPIGALLALLPLANVVQRNAAPPQ